MEPIDLRKKDYRHDIGHSLKSTCDIKPFKNRQGHFINSDRGQPFLKFDMRHWGPPCQGPQSGDLTPIVVPGWAGLWDKLNGPVVMLLHDIQVAGLL